jgi:hypothetical protein
MPYQLREEARFFRVVFSDKITPHDLVSLAHELTVIEQARPVAPNRLIDLSQIDGRHLTIPTSWPLLGRGSSGGSPIG